MQPLAQKTLAAAVAVAFTAFSASALASGKFHLSSKTVLDPDQEVQNPAVVSAGLANAIIGFNRGFREARVKLTYANLEGTATRLHLHCAPAGQNGPVALGLVDLVAAAVDNSETVTLDSNTISGTIRNSQLPQGSANSCGIHDLATLAAAIDNGGIYWNLHTTAFPGGELRGQVEPLQDQRKDRDEDEDD